MKTKKNRVESKTIPDMRFKIIHRTTGLLELSCPHEVGHPLKAPAGEKKGTWGVHGCDLCCSTPSWKKEARRIKRDVIAKTSKGWMI